MVVAETTPINVARSDAEEAAAGWLEKLLDSGRRDWKASSPTSLHCQPVEELPCRVFSFAQDTMGGFAPCFGLIAGRKSRGLFWQYTTIDPATGHPLPPELALSEIETVIDVLVPAVLSPLPGPAA